MICLFPKVCSHQPLGPYQSFTSSDSRCTATVQKIVGEILPAQAGLTFAKESRDLLIECCVEFITLISSEANEISEKEAKKTIACDHIIKALEQLGFTDYVPAVLEAAAEHKEVQKVRRPTILFSKLSTWLTFVFRVERRKRTSSLIAACPWKSSHAYRRSNLHRQDRDTDRIGVVVELQLSGASIRALCLALNLITNRNDFMMQ